MRAIVALEEGVLELNFMWLPTIFGMNAALKKEMEKELSDALKGRALDERSLDDAHQMVVAFLVRKFPSVKGIDRYLDAMKYLEVSS